MSTAVEPKVVPPSLEDLTHFICCHDPNPVGSMTVGYCGSPTVREADEIDDQIFEVTCIVCMDLDCSDVCPIYGVCCP